MASTRNASRKHKGSTSRSGSSGSRKSSSKRGTSSKSSRSENTGRHGRGSSGSSSSSGSRKGMSTAAKVAIATTAGAAVGATAAGLAATDKGRELRMKVTRKVKDLVNQGSITLKKSGIGDVVGELEHMIGEMLTGGRGRNESRSDDNQPMISTRGSGSRRSR